MVGIYTEYLRRSNIKNWLIFTPNLITFLRKFCQIIRNSVTSISNSVQIRSKKNQIRSRFDPKKIKFCPDSTQKNQIRSISVFIISMFFFISEHVLLYAESQQSTVESTSSIFYVQNRTIKQTISF